MEVKGAWFTATNKDQIVIEFMSGELNIVDINPIKVLLSSDFRPFYSKHPRLLRGEPIPLWLYRQYGLKKAEETATEVVHIRLSQADKDLLKMMADGKHVTVSEFIREWVQGL